MKKVVYGLILGIIFVFVLVAGLPERLASSSISEQPLFKALDHTSSKVQSASINAWGQLPDGDFTIEQLSGMTVKAMSQLGLKEDEYTITKVTNPNNLCVRAEAIREEFHAVALFQARKTEPNKPLEGYVVVNVELNHNVSDKSASWQQELKNIIKEFGCQPHINTCLTGWLDGKLNKEDWGARLENAFQAANIATVDKTQYANFASYTGYSPAIAEYIQYGNKKVNVNIAMRYSPHDNRTYIIVGSPVITREY